MNKTDLTNHIITLFKDFRPDIDTSPGTEFHSKFLSPLVNLLASEIDDVDTFVLNKIQQAFPSLAISEEGGAAIDIARKIPGILLEGLRQHIYALRRERAGLGNPLFLSQDSASDLASNFFVERVTAGYSTVVVRLYFASPVRVILFVENTARTATGLLFKPLEVTEITPEELLTNREGSLFYKDVLFVAAEAGSSYMIPARAIFTVDGVPGLVKATNYAPSTPVYDDETPAQLAERIINSITDRSLVTVRGISTVIHAISANTGHIEVVGFGDPEMTRDILTADSLIGNIGGKIVAEGPKAVTTYQQSPLIEKFPFVTYVKLYDSKDNVVFDSVDNPGDCRIHFTCHNKDHPIIYALNDVKIFCIDGYIKSFGYFNAFPLNIENGAPILRVPKASVDLQPSIGDDVSVYDAVILSLTPIADKANPPIVSWDERLLTSTFPQSNNSVITICPNFAQIACGSGASAGTTVVINGFVYLKVPGHFSWPSNAQHAFLSIECENDEEPLHQIVEFSSSDKRIMDISYIEDSYTYFKIPSTGIGFNSGSSQFSETVSVLINKKYKWTYWTGDISYLGPVAKYRDALTYYPVVIMYVLFYDPYKPTNLESDLVPRLDNSTNYGWVLLKPLDVSSSDFRIGVSHIPGGIINPHIPPSSKYPEGLLLVENNKVHLGGKVDIYCKPRAGYTSLDYRIDTFRDTIPLLAGSNLLWENNEATSIKVNSIISKIDLRCASVCYYKGNKFIPNRINAIKDNWLVLDNPILANTTNPTHFYISSPYVSYSLYKARIRKIAGNDLESFIASDYVKTSADISLIEPNDTLEILSGSNQGVYTVIKIEDNKIFLDRQVAHSLKSQQFEIYTTKIPARLPVVAPIEVVMEDGGGSVNIPYGKPLGIVAKQDFYGGGGVVRFYFLEPTFFYYKGYLTSSDRLYSCNSSATLYKNKSTTSQAVLYKTHIVIPGDLYQMKQFLLSTKICPLKVPVISTKILSDKVAIANTSLAIQIEGKPVKTMVFTGVDPIPLTGGNSIVSQIESFFPEIKVICNSIGAQQYKFELRSDSIFTIKQGTANDILGLSAGSTNLFTTTKYTISNVSKDSEGTRITVSEEISNVPDTGIAGVAVVITDTGFICFPSQMTFDSTSNLYYFDSDVTCISETEQPNLFRDDALSLDSTPVYYGYHFYSENTSLCNSVYDSVYLRVSCWFYDKEASSLDSYRYLVGDQSVTVRYYSFLDCSVIQGIADYSRRVVSADLMCKACLPVFICGRIVYNGGEDIAVVKKAIFNLFDSMKHSLDITYVRNLLVSYGASNVKDPIVLYAIVFDNDRNSNIYKIYDVLDFPRTSGICELPDKLVIVRE